MRVNDIILNDFSARFSPRKFRGKNNKKTIEFEKKIENKNQDKAKIQITVIEIF